MLNVRYLFVCLLLCCLSYFCVFCSFLFLCSFLFFCSFLFCFVFSFLCSLFCSFVLLFFCSFVLKISNLPFYRKFLSRYHMRIFVSWKAYSILRVASLAKSQIPFTLGCLLCSSRARLINLLHENYFHYNVI